jgi:hypothetical protein
MDQPILVGEFPAKEFQAGSGDDLPNGATTEDLVDYLYNSGYAGGFSWSFIPDDWTSNPALEEDILVSTISFTEYTELFSLEWTSAFARKDQPWEY